MIAMPQNVSDNSRIELRVRSDQKAMIARAAALEHLDLTGFIMRAVLPAAEAAFEKAERIRLSERDSLRLLKLLENPPKAPQRLRRAARQGNKLA
jgi:uncharacterized protein (DUF1778 family)